MEKIKSKGYNFKQGYYIPVNKHKLINKEDSILYKSSWELIVLQFLDLNDQVQKYSTKLHDVPYEYKGTIYSWKPDFYFETVDKTGIINKIIADLKSKSSITVPKLPSSDMNISQLKRIGQQYENYSKNIAKLQGCKDYATLNGYKFSILTEDNIKNLNTIKNIDKKSTFNAWSSQTIDSKNGGYKHVIQDKTLYLEKDGVVMELNDQEVMQMLKALGMASRDFQSGFKFS